MRESFKSLDSVLLPFAIVAISFGLYLLYKDIDAGVTFFIKTLYFFAFLVSAIGIILLRKSGESTGIALYLIVAIYLLVAFIPSIRFYMDIPQFLADNYSEYTGIVKSSNDSGLSIKVTVHEEIFTFIFPTTKDEFPIGSNMKIYYLPNSNQGISYEILQNIE